MIKQDHLKKNYTIKELKKINEEAKKPYNIFCKYVLVIQVDNKSLTQEGAQENALEICIDQLSRKVITDEDFDRFATRNSYEFRTLTSIVKGMYNIMNQVKEDLEFFQYYSD